MNRRARWRRASPHAPPPGPGARSPRVVVAPPGDRLVEEGEVVGRLDVVAERLERPDHDVAMAVPVADLRVRLEHEPLRPVAAVSCCCAKTIRRISLTGASCSSASRSSTGPWQTSRVPQAAPPDCSSPCGTVRWIMAFCASQGRIVFDRGDALAVAGQAQVAGDAAPVARGGVEARGLACAAGVLGREPFRLGRLRQRADDGEVERLRRVRPERHEAAAARPAVAWSSSSPPIASSRRACR